MEGSAFFVLRLSYTSCFHLLHECSGIPPILIPNEYYCMKKLIAPSLLAADFSNLKDAFDIVNDSEADWLHFDVMDGRFVPNISFGFPILKAAKAHMNKPVDVHLMIVEPEKYIDAFQEAGAAVLTVHQEATVHLDRTL